MAHEYAGLEELKATLELSGENFADPDITRALTAASRGIDNLCGRRFWLDTDDTSVRKYTPESGCLVRIDDLVDLASLKVDQDGDGTFEETWTLGTDFVLAPANASSDGRPWTTVKARKYGNYSFPCVEDAVQVTGQFGWGSVPAEVKEATIILASKLMRRAREAPFGVIAIGLEAGGAMHIARTDPDIMFLVGEYVRDPVAVA